MNTLATDLLHQRGNLSSSLTHPRHPDIKLKHTICSTFERKHVHTYHSGVGLPGFDLLYMVQRIRI